MQRDENGSDRDNRAYLFCRVESDETYHWHKCKNCDEISGKAEYTYTDGICVCGHIKPNTDPMPEFDPIDTLDELYNTPKPDEKDFTAEKYGANYELFYENAVKEYNAAQDMQKAIFDNLEKILTENITRKALGSLGILANAEIIKWELISNQNNNVADTIRAFILYNNTKLKSKPN